MDVSRFSQKIFHLWNDWEIRAMVLLSLSLQFILMMFGSKRKYIANTSLLVLIWLSYLSADVVATIALGNIARSQGDDQEDCSTEWKGIIQAYWAPFLLLHLGGPDTITAYSREDTELWLRHLLVLVVQVGLAFYIFIRSWSHTKLTYLAIPMFVAGIIKYGERAFALRSSTTNSMRKALRSVQRNLRNTESNVNGSQLPVTQTETPPDFRLFPRQRPAYRSYLDQAFYLMRMSVFLFEDLLLGLGELKDSYSMISVMSSEKAYELIEVELGFIYDLFYTKAGVVYSTLGYLFRCITFLSSLTSLVLFSVIIEKKEYPAIDVDITYFLLIGALVLEVSSFFYFILSDWAMVLYFDSHPAAICLHKYSSSCKRWSGSIAQYNLISSCFKIGPSKYNCLNSFDILENMKKHSHINWKDMDEHMKELIFSHLLEKGKQINCNMYDTNLRNKLINQRGNGVLEMISDPNWIESLAEDIKRINELEFYHSLLIWHIATELCYYGDGNDNSIRVNNLSHERKISELLSNYMMYLLVIRPSLLPKAIVDVLNDPESRCQNACEYLRKFFVSRRSLTSAREACIKLLKTGTPRASEATAISRYVVVDGVNLARRLNDQLPLELKWKMISQVWIEMLAYAASHCEWKEHARHLRRGGELLTHVCLLMAHFGLSQQYREVSMEEREMFGRQPEVSVHEREMVVEIM